MLITQMMFVSNILKFKRSLSAAKAVSVGVEFFGVFPLT